MAKSERVRIFGASVEVHWSILAAIAVVAPLALSSPLTAIVAVGAYLSIIVIHELAHALVARGRGYRVHRIQIALLHGRCEYEAPDYEWDAIAVAWAGVLAQILLAVPFIVLDVNLAPARPDYVDALIIVLGYLNLLWAVVNLIPVPPLDGATAWKVLSLLRSERVARRETERVLRYWRRK